MANLDFKRRSIAPSHSKKIHNAYYAMIDRCYKPTNSRYKTYGGRGIRVCDRWLGRDGFINFISDMGEPTSVDLSLDRIDNDSNYSPENCQWLEKRLQCKKRTISHYYELNGKKMLLGEIAEMYGVKRLTIYRRMKHGGMTLKEALSDLPPKNARLSDTKNKFKLTYKGNPISVSRLAEEVGIKKSTLSMRLYKYGWTVEKSINTPVRERG